MALKTIMLRRSIELKRRELKELRDKDADFATREAELETAINEAESEDDRKAVQEEVERFETEKAAHESAKTTLTGEIEGLEHDLSEAEANAPQPAPAPDYNADRNKRSSTMETTINIRALPMGQRAFDALPMAQRTSILQQDDVKAFLQQVRACKGGQLRGVSGGDIMVPTVMLPLISENVYRYSKLVGRVHSERLNGQGRQPIAGTVPEAVWTEGCGAINELSINFNQIVVDGYKVAGFVPVCNSLLEDSDINLASYIVEMLSQSIGYATDKAILYGRSSGNKKMPMGIVTRLAQQSKPADYPADGPAWEDVHTSNLITIDATKNGAEFWAALTLAAGNAWSKYARGDVFWAMSTKTHNLLKSKAITFTAGGNVVANVYDALPIVNGNIVLLEFVPYGDIIGGYGDLYTYSNRGEMALDMSRDVQFLQDNTVFRGKARADGQPVIASAFVGININGASVTTTMGFAADTANDADLESVSGLSLSPAFDPDKTTYTATMTTAAEVAAAAAQPAAKVTLTYNGKNHVNGASLTPVTGTKPLVVTVHNGNATKVYMVNVTKS